MARNGSGTYNLVVNSWYPPVNGVSATAVDWQSLIEDVAAAVTQSVSADGQTPITGNLAMGGNILTGLGAGSATGHSVRWQQLFDQGTELDLASAATTDIGSQNTNFLRITGTTTITSFGTVYRGPRFVRFSGALTLTHNASTLILPTGSDITTAAGDRAIVVPKATTGTADGWLVVAYQRASGGALVVDLASATGTLPIANGGTGSTSGATAIAALFGTRVDVASAATVDLSSVVSSINITGTTTITAFTVAVGRIILVRFNASLTLTNNASVVTQTGANIVTAAGDTCILRATAANTVEVLAYTRGIPQAVGDGQTWTNVTGSRAFNTDYTNSTGRPIMVVVSAAASGLSNTTDMLIGGVTVSSNVSSFTVGSITFPHTISAVVPSGSTYRVNVTGSVSLSNWAELR